MEKVIDIRDNLAFISQEDGSFIKVDIDSLNFTPKIGDKIKIYKTEDEWIYEKVGEGTYGFGNNHERSHFHTDEPVNHYHYYDQSPVYYPQNHRVNKIIYLLCIVFLGGFGVHRLYAGYKSSFFIRLLFCWTWIPSFIAIFDFIFGLFKETDSEGFCYI